VFAPLNARSHDEVAALLGGLSSAAQARLVGAMQTIERLLGDRAELQVSYVLRSPQPGDLVGSCIGTVLCMPRNTATTSSSRPWSPRS